jgi:hypothetical protein
MSWTCNPAYLLEKEGFVSALCRSTPIISHNRRLILISKMMPSESRYDCIVAFQYYFGKPKNFLMGVFA